MTSIEIALKNSNCNVYLLISKIDENINSLCKQVSIDSFYFNYNKKIFNCNDTNFRDGFWMKTTDRFFILNEFVKKNNISNFFHAELDNLIFDISTLPQKLDQIGKGIFIPKDSKDRCIASLVYINDITILTSFCKYIIQNPNNLTNDMYLLGDFTNKNPKNSFILPNESAFNSTNQISYLNHENCAGIFDAAAIGQFLFGIDPRNSSLPVFNKFKNENSKYDLEKCIFHLSITSNFAFINNINLYNIHVHSKIFKKLIDENWLYSLVQRINKKRRTLITLNILYKG